MECRDRRNNHEAKLILFDSAVKYLQTHGLNPANINLSDLNNRFNDLDAKKASTISTLETARDDISAMESDLENLQKHFGLDYEKHNKPLDSSIEDV